MAQAHKKFSSGKRKYTLGTFTVQILMTVVAILFFTPVMMVINYSFKTKRELYLSSPIALPESFYIDNYITAYKKLNLSTTFKYSNVYSDICCNTIFIMWISCLGYRPL